MEDTLLLATPFHPLQKQTVDFVRVVIVNNNNCICCVGGQFIANEDVCIYDSMVRSSIEPNLAMQARKWYPAEKKKIVFRVQKTTKQVGCWCGYYALAYATTICFNEDPETYEFLQDLMPQHFISSIQNQEIRMFPHRRKKVRKTEHMILTI